MNQIMKALFALMLLGYSCGISRAQKFETAESEYEMASGQTASFVISLKEAKESTYNALTFSMLMPEGINLKGNPILTDKLENPFCISQESIVLPLETSQLDNLMFYALGDMAQNRKIKMAIASASPLPGTDVDSLLTFEIKTDENIAPDLYLIKLQNLLFEYEPKGKDYGNDMAVRIRIYKLGDADKNDAVDVVDATDVINYIMGRQIIGDYNIMLADMNNDGDVDIFDIMKLVNVILTGKLPDPNNAPMRSAGIYEDMLLAFSKNGVAMGIPDAQRFTSFQFEIEIPDDVELTGAELIDASTNHMVQFAKIEDHHYRVVGLSIDNSLLNGNNGNNLIDLCVPNCGRIKILNAMFVSPQGQVTYFNDTEIEDGITTGIRSTSISDTESIYDLLGRKVQMKDGRLPKGIYIINNKRVVVK